MNTDNDNAKTETKATENDTETATEEAWEREAMAAAENRPRLAYIIGTIAKLGPTSDSLLALAWKLAGCATLYGPTGDDPSPWKLLVAYVNDAFAANAKAEDEDCPDEERRDDHDWSAFSVAIHECFRVTTSAHLDAVARPNGNETREEAAEFLALTSDMLFALKVLGYAVDIDLEEPAPMDLDAVVRRVHEAASGIGDGDVLTREAQDLFDASYTNQETEDAAHAVARLMLVVGERLTTRDPVKAAQ